MVEVSSTLALECIKAKTDSKSIRMPGQRRSSRQSLRPWRTRSGRGHSRRSMLTSDGSSLDGWIMDEWLRTRMRMLIWKRWKKPRTKYRKLIGLGIPSKYAYMAANTRKGIRRAVTPSPVKHALSNQKLEAWDILRYLITSSWSTNLQFSWSLRSKYWKHRIRIRTYGAVRGRRLITASYSIGWL